MLHWNLEIATSSMPHLAARETLWLRARATRVPAIQAALVTTVATGAKPWAAAPPLLHQLLQLLPLLLPLTLPMIHRPTQEPGPGRSSAAAAVRFTMCSLHGTR